MGGCVEAHLQRGQALLAIDYLPNWKAARGMGAQYGIGPVVQERLSPFILRRWEVLSEPTPNVGENDTSLSLGLFEAIKLQ